MSNREIYPEKAHLWIIKIQNFLSRIIGVRIIASICIFYIPIIASGYILQFTLDYEIFSRGIFLALLWIAFAPYLIQYAYKVVNDFFVDHVHIFRDKEEWARIYESEIATIQSSRYLIFGIPWGIVTSFLLWFTSFREAPILVQIWALLSFFVFFVVSSIGFSGIFGIVKLIPKLCNSDIIFNPFHPDKFGGYSEFGRFSVKAALLFSSGAVVFPLVFEIVSRLENIPDLIEGLIYFVAGLYIFTMIFSFVIPIQKIKDYVDREKKKVIQNSWDELRELTKEFKDDKNLNLKKGAEVLMHYYLFHSKLLEIKDYPYDFKVLFEFGLSFILPVAIALMEILAK